MKDRLKTLLVFKNILSTAQNDPTRKEMETQIMKQIEEGRRLMGLDILVKTESGEVATEKNTQIIDLLNMVVAVLLSIFFLSQIFPSTNKSRLRKSTATKAI